MRENELTEEIVEVNIRKNKARIRAITDIVDSEYRLIESEKLVKFIDSYIDCEVLAHKIIDYYYIDKKNKNYTNPYVDVRELEKAFKNFDLGIIKDELENIFYSKKNTLDDISIRVLRNNYFHNRSKSHSKKIIENFEKYNILMDKFIMVIKTKWT